MMDTLKSLSGAARALCTGTDGPRSRATVGGYYYHYDDGKREKIGGIRAPMCEVVKLYVSCEMQASLGWQSSLFPKIP